MSYNLSRLNFLVVEDNSLNQKLIRGILHVLGCRNIVLASDGAEAFSRLKAGTPPDIIITDWQMPILDGVEMTRMIRAGGDVPEPHVPIIMITAYSERERIEEARDAGINEIIVTPFSATDLYKRIIAVVENPRTFIDDETFNGPDRRRGRRAKFKGEDRRDRPTDNAADRAS